VKICKLLKNEGEDFGCSRNKKRFPFEMDTFNAERGDKRREDRFIV